MIKVFVVDHAAGVSRGIRKLLPETGIPGFKIKFTNSYRDILEGFRANLYDVCVIDSAGGNGTRLFAQARSLGYAGPVILVTSDNAGESVNAIRSGVADCLIRSDMTAAVVERLICSVVEQARTATQQSERARRYLALSDNTDEIIFTHDLNGNLTSMNSAGEHALGYSQEEWSGLAVTQVIGHADRENARQVIQQTIDARRQNVCEILIVTRQGQSLPVEANLHLVYQQGRAVEVQWVVRNSSAPNQLAATLLRNAQLHRIAQNTSQSFSA